MLIFYKILQICQNFAEFLLNFDQNVSGFSQNAATFQSFHGAFTEPSPRIADHSGPVPVPADAACAQMFPFLAHAAPLGLPLPLSAMSNAQTRKFLMSKAQTRKFRNLESGSTFRLARRRGCSVRRHQMALSLYFDVRNG